MSQDKQFHQYGYDHYLKAPRKRKRLSSDDGFFEKPVVKYSSFAIVLALFATVIYLSYPSEQNSNVQIPIVQADLRPVKAIPEDPQGMDIPFQDNTFYASLGDDGEEGEESAPTVKNLFAEEDVAAELLTKEEALAQAVTSENPYEEEADAPKEALLQKIERVESADEPEEIIEGRAIEVEESVIKETISEEVLQKVKPTEVKAFEGRVASAAIAVKPTLHAAATSPDTLEFVRSVLKDEAREGDEHVSDLEPSAGVATIDPIGSKQYFVQLASITDRSRAPSEYSKLQERFLVLAALPYRVQEAKLPSGTFFRIQTGPFSKEQADEICTRIKAQKPGGCLVVR